MGEKEFEREVLDRLMRIETILTRCPECQAEVAKHSQIIAAQNERIDAIYRSASLTAGVVSAVISFVAFMLGVMKAK